MNCKCITAALLLLAIGFPPIPLLAQWTYSGGPSGGEINCFAVKDSSIYVGTWGQGVYLSTNNGKNWQARSSGISGETALSVYSMAVGPTGGMGGSKIFAGTASGFYSSTDNGLTWLRDTTLPTGYLSIDCILVTATRMFVGTGGHGVFVSSDNGSSWSELNNGLTDYFIKSFTVVGDDIYLGNGRGVFRLPKNATTWLASSTGLPQYNSVVALLSTSGGIFAGTEGSGVYISKDKGASWDWANLGLPSDLYLYANAFISVGQNIFVGTYKGVFLSTDNGGTWDPMNTGLANISIRAFGLLGSYLFAGTFGNGVFRSSDNGTNWAAASHGLPSLYVRAVTVCQGVLLAGTSQGIFRLSGQDIDWTQVTSGLPTNLYVVTLATIQNICFAGTYGGAYRSTDKGLNWTQITSGLASTAVYSFVPMDTLVLAAAASSVFLSTDRGSTWLSMGPGLAQYTSVYGIAVYGSTMFAGLWGGGVYRLTPVDSRWVRVDPTRAELTWPNCMAAGGGIVFAGTNGSGVWGSTDNGQTWSDDSWDMTNRSVGSLVVIGSQIVAGAGDGIYVSRLDYLRWTRTTSMTAYSFALGDSNLYAATNTGIWQYPLSKLSVSVKPTSPAEAPSTFSLEQNYPNPFNPSTVIEFSIPRSAYVALKVYDVLGKEVATLLSESLPQGTHTVKWSAKGLSSGVYFYRLNANEFTEAKKLVLKR